MNSAELSAYLTQALYLTLWLSLPRELAPQEDQGFIIGFGIAPEGSTVEYTDKYAKQMEAQFRQLPDLQRQFQIVGFPSITTTIGFALPAAIRLSRIKFARPTDVQESSESPAPCSR